MDALARRPGLAACWRSKGERGAVTFCRLADKCSGVQLVCFCSDHRLARVNHHQPPACPFCTCSVFLHVDYVCPVRSRYTCVPTSSCSPELVPWWPPSTIWLRFVIRAASQAAPFASAVETTVGLAGCVNSWATVAGASEPEARGAATKGGPEQQVERLEQIHLANSSSHLSLTSSRACSLHRRSGRRARWPSELVGGHEATRIGSR